MRKKVYPCKPQFYYLKVGCRGRSLHGLVFVMFAYNTSLRDLPRVARIAEKGWGKVGQICKALTIKLCSATLLFTENFA